MRSGCVLLLADHGERPSWSLSCMPCLAALSEKLSPLAASQNRDIWLQDSCFDVPDAIRCPGLSASYLSLDDSDVWNMPVIRLIGYAVICKLIC